MLKNVWDIVTIIIMQKWKFGDMTFSLYYILALSFIIGVAKIILGSRAPVIKPTIFSKQIADRNNHSIGSESKNYYKFKKVKGGPEDGFV